MGEINIEPKFNIHETYKKVRILNPYRNSELTDSSPLIFTINTNLGTGASMEIPTTSIGYNYSVKWGDGVTTSDHTTNALHTYAAHGVYTLEITGSFPKFYFNTGGDKLKLTSIDQWGGIIYSTDQNKAFYGVQNLNVIADDALWMNTITNGLRMFYASNLTSLPSGITLNSLESALYMFYASNLTSLPNTITLTNLIDGYGMFFSTNLTSLPNGMTLDSLINGGLMFNGSNLNYLPSTMILNNLTNGNEMFRGTSITSLPSGMTLDSLINGGLMFYGLNLTSLPSTMNLNTLSNGNRMFFGADFTSLPSGITLPNLTDGVYMFYQVTINTIRYSQLLIDMESGNANNNVSFHGGHSKYNAAGETARNALVTRGWIITDGGLAV